MALGASAAVVAPPLTPNQGNTFDLYAGASELYDTNIYRISSDRGSIASVSAPNASRSDQVTTVSAGADVQRLLGRQVFLLDLHADENRFAHNTALNNTSYFGKFLWNWELGPYLSGTAGANYSHALVSFGEALYLGKDLIDSTNYFGTARYQVGPHWAVYGGVSESGIAHSVPLARSGDFHTKGGNLGAEYALDVSDTFSLEYRYAEGRFPPGQFYTIDGFSFSPNFHDDTVLFTVNHAFSDKTQLVADAGYQKRFYPNTSVGGFAGEIGRVTLNWQPTDKTQVAFAAYRELHAYLVSQSNYFVSTGISIAPTWFATEKISLSAGVTYEKQDYIAQSQSVAQLGPLNAKIAAEHVNLNYSPRDSWQLSLTAFHTNRTANAPSFAYNDDLALFSVLYKTR